MEQPGCGRHRHQAADLPAATRLAEDSDVAGITAEGRDVVADPLQCLDEVEQSDIARVCIVGRELRELEVAEQIEAVIQGDNHDVALVGQPRAVEYVAGARKARKVAAVKPDHHRTLAAISDCRGPDTKATPKDYRIA